MHNSLHITCPILRRRFANTTAGFTAILVTLLLLFVSGTAYAQSCERPQGMQDAWGFTARDLESLADSPEEPQLVEKNVRTLGDNVEGELEARLHMHALFPQTLEEFREVIVEIERQKDFLPNLEVSEVLCSDGPPISYARVRQKLAFRFLFFNREYEYILHYFLDESAGPEATLNLWWHLAESIGDQIVATEGSWYFEPVVVNGRSYTYMAYGVRTVFREQKMGLQTAMERFGERNTAAAMEALQSQVKETDE